MPFPPSPDRLYSRGHARLFLKRRLLFPHYSNEWETSRRAATNSKFKQETAMKFRALVLATTLILTGSFATHAGAQAASREVRGPIWVSVPASATDLESIQVKAPATGNLIITVTGTVVYEHTQGTAGNYCLQLSQTAGNVGGCVPDAGSDSAIRSYVASGVATTVPGFGASEPYSIVRTYPVRAGDTYTFYLNGYEENLTTSWLFQPAITAVYVPDTLVP
jgi:hypothetical protein